MASFRVVQSCQRIVVATLVVVLWVSTAKSDPCGMVPPVYVGDGSPITRVGAQKTFVCYKDGVETVVIRPGFSGKVDEFGMLIPFPNPPAVRKISDEIFSHIAAAIDPPEVVVDLNPLPEMLMKNGAGRVQAQAALSEGSLKFDQVKVLRQEAVGMYEVAVLEAGSAAALKRWVDDHGFRYPDGMDKVAQEYVDLRWCFVAVKTRVGTSNGVKPRPGQRTVHSKLPKGSTFDGNVQAMGFRFKSEKLVVPMRLSAFNEGKLRNIVYLLTDGPKRIHSIPEEYVVRQISGNELYRNLTGPLPLRIIGGTASDIPERQVKSLERRRDPAPHNGAARDLFGSDLLAVQNKVLALPHEETEKVLLRIGERLGLRAKQIDQLNDQALADARRLAVKAALDDIKSMTLTVVDGDFPREVLAGQNLNFDGYRMSARRNRGEAYNAVQQGPRGKQPGIRVLGSLEEARSAEKLSAHRTTPRQLGLATWAATALLLVCGIGLVLTRR